MDLPRSVRQGPLTGGRTGKGRVALTTPRPGLSLKLLLIVVSVSLIGVLISASLVLSLERQTLIKSALAASIRLDRLLEADLEYAMLHDNWTLVDEIVHSAVAEGAVESIRILDAQGIVRVSSRPGEVGRRLNRDDPQCQSCHQGDSAPTRFVLAQGYPELLCNVETIHNQPRCQSCHDPSASTLGYLLIATPLSDLGSQLASAAWRIVLASLATLALLVSLLHLALRKLVTQPVSQLAKGLSAVAAGDLEHHVAVTSRDELGELARAFDTMRQQVRASHAEAELRNRELSLLNEVAQAMSQTLELQPLLDAALDIVIGRLDMEAGLIYLCDEEQGSLVRRASRGYSSEQLAEIERYRREVCDFVAEVVQSGQMIYRPDASSKDLGKRLWAEAQARSSLGLPLISRAKVMGYLGMISKPGRQFDRRSAETLLAVGKEVGVAIENALLYTQVRRMAALEERDRLARELHDNLAQALGYLNLKSAIVDKSLAEGHAVEARAGLQEMKSIVQTAYTDVREAIFSLRAAVSPGPGLLATVREYLAEYRAHYGLDVRLRVDREPLPELGEEAEIQVIRIVQEALTNVRKHARATKAWVHFREEEERVVITVEDNGCGFDPAHVAAKGRRSFGLQVMRERAQGVGATVEIDSQPGRGTRVVIRIPPARGK